MRKQMIVRLSFVLAIIIIVPTIIYATAISALTPDPFDSASKNKEEKNVEIENLENSNADTNDHFAGVISGSKQATSTFIVPIHYGHVTLSFINHSSATTTISVSNIQSNKVYFTHQIAAGAMYRWRSADYYKSGMQSGDYTVTYRSSSASVNMNYSGIASNSMEKVEMN